MNRRDSIDLVMEWTKGNAIFSRTRRILCLVGTGMASGGEKKQRKLWKDEDMMAALESVKSKGLTVTQATSTYNVPRKTLDDWVNGRVVHGTNPGWDTVLSPTEEKALCNYLVYMAERGFPLTCTMVMLGQLPSALATVVVSTLNWVQGNIGGPGSVNVNCTQC